MSEARQRWRVIYARGEEARYLSHLDAAKLWERAFRRVSLPIAVTEGMHPRPRVVFAAPLPLGMLAERELVDLYLADRLTIGDLRRRLETSLPRGFVPIDLFDVWLGAPALAVQLVAADYRMAVLGAQPGELRRAADALLAAPSLAREKRRETKAVAYDLRPLLIDVQVGAGALEDPRGAVAVRIRVRHSQDQGSGRAEEVVNALGDELGAGAGERPGLEMIRPVRERLWLGEEMPAVHGFDCG